jgi:hypothetical protein
MTHKKAGIKDAGLVLVAYARRQLPELPIGAIP